jgi:hypothetical protein
MTYSIFNLSRTYLSNSSGFLWYSNRTQGSLQVDKRFKEYVYNNNNNNIGSDNAFDSKKASDYDFPMRKKYCWNFSTAHEANFRQSTQNMHSAPIVPSANPEFLTLPRIRIENLEIKFEHQNPKSSKKTAQYDQIGSQNSLQNCDQSDCDEDDYNENEPIDSSSYSEFVTFLKAFITLFISS